MKKYIVFGGSVFVNLVTVLSYYNDTKSLKEALWKTMPVLIICLVAMIISQYLDLRALRKDNEKLIQAYEEQINSYKSQIDDLTKRNKNISKQFNIKKSEIEKMKEFWGFLNTSFVTALSSNKNDRFKEAYNQYLTYTEHLGTFEEE